MNKINQIRHSIAYLISTGVEFLIPLMALPVFMSVLSPRDYGAMALAQAYAVFVVSLANLGMTVSYDRNYFQYEKVPSDVAKLFYSSILFVSFNMALVGFLTFLFRDSLSGVMQIKGLGDLLVFVFFAEVSNSLLQYYMIHLRNGQKAREYMVNDVVGNILSVALSLSFVFIVKAGVIGFVIGKLIANVVMLCFMQLRLLYSLPFALDKRIFISTLKFSLPLAPRIFLGAISTQFDKFLLGLLGNLDGVGIYNIAQKLAYGIFAFMVSIQNVFIPRAYKMMFNDGVYAGKNVGTYLTPFAYICTALAMGVALFSEEFVYFFSPLEYHGMVGVIIVFSVYYAFQFIGRITGMQLLYLKKTAFVSALSLVTVFLNVLISVPFILRWGAVGAAWGALIVSVFSIGISFYIGQRSFYIVWEKKRVWAIFGSLFVAAMILLIMNFLAVVYPLRLLIKFVFVGMYLYLGFRCGWIGRDQLMGILEMASKKKVMPVS